MDDKNKILEKSIFDISARLISVPPAKIGREIDAGLERIGEVWGFDHIILFEFSTSANTLNIVHSHTAPGATSLSAKEINKGAPWIIDRLRNGESSLLADIREDLPEHSARGRYLLTKGIKSCLSFPLKIGNRVLGGVLLFSLKKRPSLAQNMVERLHHLVNILSGALERARTASRIDRILDFERLLSDVSARYINLSRDAFNDAIRDSLGRIGRLLDVDHCLFFKFDPDLERFLISDTFAWWPEELDQEMAEVRQWRKTDPNIYSYIKYLSDNWLRKKTVRFMQGEALPKEASDLLKANEKLKIKSAISIPVSVGGNVVGAILLDSKREKRVWPDSLVPRLRLLGEVFANALIRVKNEEKILNSLSEVKRLKDQIEADYHYLAEEVELDHHLGEIVGQSRALQKILVKVKQVAPTHTTVLVLGETGTGKGVIARLIHQNSQYRDRPLIQVNCAALSPLLIESELFGHEKGAFSGAVNKRVGRFELSNNGTLVLDEIGELPLELQSKLLRVLQNGEFERVGSSHTIRTNVRVIATTNRDLELEVEKGRFRRDLYYRLSVFPIVIPPLRERPEDIPLLVNWFVKKYSKGIEKEFIRTPQKTITALKRYAWPGNVRELENLVERAMIISTGSCLQIELPFIDSQGPCEEQTLSEVERQHIYNTLEQTNWKIEGLGGAAEKLGINPSTLRFRMKKLKIKRPSSR